LWDGPLAGPCIERGKQLVGDVDVSTSQRVHEGALSRIRVPDE